MDGLARVNGELDLFFYDALGDGGVVDGNKDLSPLKMILT